MKTKKSHAASDAWREGLSTLISVARSALQAAASGDVASVAGIAEQLDALCLLKRTGGRRSFLSAKPTREGEAVNVMVAHNPAKHPKVTRPREFDTIGFIGHLLMHSVGISYSFHPLKEDRYYLRAERPRQKGQSREGLRVFVSRVVLNAQPGEDAPFAGDDHHSYRLADLRAAKSRTYLPRAEYGREQIIVLAVVMFERVCPHGRDGLSKDEFGALLREVFAAADSYHGP
jgi:hypothetical protein